MDAKYKDYWRADPSTLMPIQRISNEDLYQLFFYASRLQAGYHLPSPPPAIIISPVASGVEPMAEHVVSERFRRIRVHAGDEIDSLLLLLLLPLSAVVNELAQHEFNLTHCNTIREFVGALRQMWNV